MGGIKESCQNEHLPDLTRVCWMSRTGYFLEGLCGGQLMWRVELVGGGDPRRSLLGSGSVLLCLHPLALMPGELYGESADLES